MAQSKRQKSLHHSCPSNMIILEVCHMWPKVKEQKLFKVSQIICEFSMNLQLRYRLIKKIGLKTNESANHCIWFKYVSSKENF